MYSLETIIEMNEKAERARLVDRAVNGYPVADPVKVARDRERCKAERESFMRYQQKTFPDMVVLRILRTIPNVRTVNE